MWSFRHRTCHAIILRAATPTSQHIVYGRMAGDILQRPSTPCQFATLSGFIFRPAYLDSGFLKTGMYENGIRSSDDTGFIISDSRFFISWDSRCPCFQPQYPYDVYPHDILPCCTSLRCTRHPDIEHEGSPVSSDCTLYIDESGCQPPKPEMSMSEDMRRYEERY